MSNRTVKMFKPRFAEAVRTGRKRQTVRPTPKREIHAGYTLDARMWEGSPYRSPHVKLGEFEIVEVSAIRIDCRGIEIRHRDGKGWGYMAGKYTNRFAQADGFADFAEMWEWFRTEHKIADDGAFEGILIRWLINPCVTLSVTLNNAMAQNYTKLFNSILQSTIWQEPTEIKVVWITMLALSDKNGEVMASIPGLAKTAGVTIKQCEEAITCLTSPDPYSRTKDEGGRRIEAIDGGWVLLNYEKYRKIASDEDRRQRNAERQKRWRERQKRNETVTGNNGSNGGVAVASHQNSQAEAEAEAEAEVKEGGGGCTPSPPRSPDEIAQDELDGIPPFESRSRKTPDGATGKEQRKTIMEYAKAEFPELCEKRPEMVAKSIKDFFDHFDGGWEDARHPTWQGRFRRWVRDDMEKERSA